MSLHLPTTPSERPPLREAAPPGWRRWIFPATVLWAMGFGAVRIFAALDAGTPPPTGRVDVLLFPGWWPVGLCVAAGVVAVVLRRSRWSPVWAAGGWLVAASFIAASATLLLDVVGILLPGVGVAIDVAGFASRAACCAGGLLVGAYTLAYQRHGRGACLACGRTPTVDPSLPAVTPWWARLAVGAAIAGCLVRLLAQVAVGLDDQLLGGSAAAVLFETGFLLAGTILPLALVCRWGRVLPAWLPLLGGRRVPRWIVLVPALGLGVGMTAYFGFTLALIATQTVTGTWQDVVSLPLWFFWIAVPAYLAWGLGLGVGALAYAHATRPPCRHCAVVTLE